MRGTALWLVVCANGRVLGTAFGEGGRGTGACWTRPCVWWFARTGACWARLSARAVGVRARAGHGLASGGLCERACAGHGFRRGRSGYGRVLGTASKLVVVLRDCGCRLGRWCACAGCSKQVVRVSVCRLGLWVACCARHSERWCVCCARRSKQFARANACRLGRWCSCCARRSVRWGLRLGAHVDWGVAASRSHAGQPGGHQQEHGGRQTRELVWWV